jgi:hypothetical protein
MCRQTKGKTRNEPNLHLPRASPTRRTGVPLSGEQFRWPGSMTCSPSTDDQTLAQPASWRINRQGAQMWVRARSMAPSGSKRCSGSSTEEASRSSSERIRAMLEASSKRTGPR